MLQSHSVWDMDYETLENIVRQYRLQQEGAKGGPAPKPQSKDEAKKERQRSRSKGKHEKQYERERRKQKQRDKRIEEEDNKQLQQLSRFLKDPFQKEKEKIQRMKTIDPKRAEQMESRLQNEMILEKRKRQIQQIASKELALEQSMSEARREDLTVLVSGLPQQAEERTIFTYFNNLGCGRIRDIKIIRDPRSKKSRGMAYVEFYFEDSVRRALTPIDKPWHFEGREYPSLRVDHSYAEKNRLAEAEKLLKSGKTEIEQRVVDFEKVAAPARILITGLVGPLTSLEDDQVRALFQPFGNVDFIEVNRDETGLCKGQAIVQYSDTKSAKSATQHMHKYELSGIRIRVQQLGKEGRRTKTGLDEDTQQFLKQSEAKITLMHKLARESLSAGKQARSNLARPPISTIPTQFVLMTDMFSLEENNSGDYFTELRLYIEQQCKLYGDLVRVTIELNSQGNVWVRYRDVASASRMQSALLNKYFDTRKIFCYFVTEEVYKDHVKD